MFDSYVSDPAHPVPYRKRPIELTYDARGSHWRPWLYEDQRFVDGRPDVLVWRTEPLTEDVTIGGDVAAHLFASTTGSDADWVVKLIDVFPDSITKGPVLGGYQLMVASEIMRGRYRQGFERARPIAPNAINEYVVDLHQQSYTFQKGHRIMVQVQSTWFPALRPQPADLRAQHLQRSARRLPRGDASGLPQRPVSVLHRPAGAGSRPLVADDRGGHHHHAGRRWSGQLRADGRGVGRGAPGTQALPRDHDLPQCLGDRLRGVQPRG